MSYGVFQKQDKLGNTIVSIRSDKFKDYLDGNVDRKSNLFSLFQQFNSGYPFGEWLQAIETIRKNA